MEEELNSGKLGGDDSVELKETRGVGRDLGSHSSSNSSSLDLDEEIRDLSVNEKIDELVNQEKLEEEEEEGVVEVEPLVEDRIRENEKLYDNIDASNVNGLETDEMKEENWLSLDENTGVSPDVTENGLEEGAEFKGFVPKEKLEESSDLVGELVSEENANAELQVEGDSKDSAAVTDLNYGENVETLIEKSVDLPNVVADKSDEPGVEVEIPENSVNQPIISLAPRARHMTSWRSCCGLFDVLRSPDR